MGTTAEELRRELYSERAHLGADLEAIGDRVSPSRMVERKRAATRERFGRLRDRVMGTADDIRSSVTQPVSEAEDTLVATVRSAPDAMRRSTTGNPLAAGLVMFGMGLVVATLVPETETEERLVEKVQPQLEGIASSAGEAAHQVVESVKPIAQQAGQDLKDEARHAMSNVKEHAADAADTTVSQAKSSTDR